MATTMVSPYNQKIRVISRSEHLYKVDLLTFFHLVGVAAMFFLLNFARTTTSTCCSFFFFSLVVPPLTLSQVFMEFGYFEDLDDILLAMYF